MVFTHPALALMSLLYLVVGIGLSALGRPVPRRSLFAMTALNALLWLGYFGTSRLLAPTNPTVVAGIARSSAAYVDPREMILAIGQFTATGVLWLLMLGPGLIGRFSLASFVILAVAGVWFAAAGTDLVTYLFARFTASHVLALAVVLALVSPAKWLEDARHALVLYAVIATTATVSYAIDLWLFERFMDERLTPGIVNVEALVPDGWPPPHVEASPLHTLFKWGVGKDYVRDVVVHVYDWYYRGTLAFHTFFASDRRSILYHPLTQRGDWQPLHRAAVERALATARDERDRVFLQFLADNYCAY